MPQYLSTSQICERYHTSRSTIHRWRDDPKICFPAPIKIGHRTLWREQDLIEFDRKFTEANQ